MYSRTPRCSSIWLIKKTSLENNFDYKISFFKRHEALSFGGFWSTPGGFVDEQDDADIWMKNYTSFYEKFNYYPDLKFRIAGLRELFEEWSILPAYKDGSLKILTSRDFELSTNLMKDFSTFCRKNQIFPAVDKLHGFIRTAPPHSSPLKRADNQWYSYFMENNEYKHIKLNTDELIDMKEFNPKEAFATYFKEPKSFSILFPQQLILMRIWKTFSYDKLKELWINNLDKMKISYQQFSGMFFVNNEKLINEESEYKTLDEYYKYAFNEFDFMPEEERMSKHGLMNLNEILSLNEITKLSPVVSLSSSSAKSIFEHHKSDMMLIFPGDYFHTNEIYPWRQRMFSRHRAYISKGKMVRYEITKDVFTHLTNKSSWTENFGSTVQ